MITKEKLATLMKEYNATSLDDLMDICPDLVLEDGYEEEDELPQLPQQKVDLAEYFLNYKESDGLGDVSGPYGC